MLTFNLIEKAQAVNYIPLSGTDNPLIQNLLNVENSNFDRFFDGMYKFGIAIAIILAVIMIIVGGIQYMTTDAISDKGEGRKKIQGAFIGLLIAVSSFAILYTINPDILTTSLNFQGLKTNLNDQTSQIRQTDEDWLNSLNETRENLGLPPISNDDPSVVSEYLENNGLIPNQSESATRKHLEDYGIFTNNTTDNPNRTLVSGLKPSTIDGLINIKQSIVGQEGRLVLTAGNESGHAQGEMSHSNGYKFDLGRNSNINNWLEISEFVRRSTGQSNLNYNQTYYGTVPNTGQRYEVRLENTGGEHFDFKIYPHDAP